MLNLQIVNKMLDLRFSTSIVVRAIQVGRDVEDCLLESESIGITGLEDGSAL